MGAVQVRGSTQEAFALVPTREEGTTTRRHLANDALDLGVLSKHVSPQLILLQDRGRVCANTIVRHQIRRFQRC
jgi:hypothetical protein